MGFNITVRRYDVGKCPHCGSYAVVPACILNPKSLNLRKGMAYVEKVSIRL